MRHIDRLPEPDILVRKHSEWQKAYETKLEKNSGARPDSTKYGNPAIREKLYTASYGKCYYCESMLLGKPKEIDHHVEVSIAPELAYSWDNLYLACTTCNDKEDNNTIPVTDALDPCRDSDEEILSHITFEKELICSQSGSHKGLNTIKKYHLRNESLNYKRSKWLNKLRDEIQEVEDAMRKEHRWYVTDEEKMRIMRYMQPDRPYSLMSEVYLKTYFSWILK